MKMKFRKSTDTGQGAWRELVTLDELIWAGVYLVRLAGDDTSLPFSFVDNETVTLVVKDHNVAGALQNNRVVVQTITRVDLSTGDVLTFTRARRYVDGSHRWGDWVSVGAVTTDDIQNNSVTAQKLSTDVRDKVNNPLRSLFIAAGALYNDTDAPIMRKAPWKESVQHLPGHYYLNGLGDITETQMAKIYNRGLFNDYDKCPLGYGSHNSVRTNLCRRGLWNATIQGGYFAYNTMAETLNLHITTNNTMTTTCAISVSTSTDQFVGSAKRLRIIDPRALLSSASWSSTAFEGCTALEEVRVKGLKSNIIFKDSPALSKASVLYMIENSTATAAITITLNADAYARLADDADVVAALEAQPLITLVSA